jgi:hypothetical protein
MKEWTAIEWDEEGLNRQFGYMNCQDKRFPSTQNRTISHTRNRKGKGMEGDCPQFTAVYFLVPQGEGVPSTFIRSRISFSKENTGLYSAVFFILKYLYLNLPSLVHRKTVFLWALPRCGS